jgi:hypothetical protein
MTASSSTRIAALAILLVGLIGWSADSAAQRSIVVLDFELRDLTLDAGSPEARAQAAAVGPLLRKALAASADLRVVELPPGEQAAADRAEGYLFDHPEAAAELAQRHGADWIAVCRLHKPSPLFSYLIVRLVETKPRRPAGEFVVEIKGRFEETAARGTARLAEQIGAALATHAQKR